MYQRHLPRGVRSIQSWPEGLGSLRGEVAMYQRHLPRGVRSPPLEQARTPSGRRVTLLRA
ncbi:hypothetical protein [Sorangium sp. So ce1182]|uniref:hypothetical protein n=1 Tax=Sorangium sp. So ce1182 TaxID=3133334 RepID=UPI003F61431B